MHKKIMKKCAKKLSKDAKHYEEEIKHDKVEKKEAMSAAKDMKVRSKKAHEY